MKTKMQPGVLVQVDPSHAEGEILKYDRECFYIVRMHRGRDLIVHEDDMQVVEVEEENLASMRKLGGKWAAYQNVAMDSADLGRFIFLRIGPNNTFQTPPDKAPDGPHGTGWKYAYKGWVDLPLGVLRVPEPASATPLEG